MGALDHVRICDFTGQLAGAGATRSLAALGAQVIRIEDPVRQGRWDILRGSPPYPPGVEPGPEAGGGFANHNVEKLGVTLNLRTEEGRDLLRRLVPLCDVVTENFAAGVLAGLGFDYPALVALRPDIIYVSNCGFGHDGPYREFRTWGPIVQAVCGLTFSSGLPGLAPAGWGYSYMDHHGGNLMAVAVLAALVYRARTGEGQWVDMACTEAGAGLCGPALLDWSVNDRPLRRDGMPHSNRSQSPPMAPHGIFPCAGDDEWVALACRDDGDWERLGAAIGEPWCRDRRWRSLEGRLAGEDELEEQLARWTSGRPVPAVVAAALGAGVPAAPVTRPEDRIDHDPDTAAWGLWPEVDHPVMGRTRVDGLPLHLSATDWHIGRPAPLLGQHNRDVFGGLLGLPDDELDRLAAAGVL